MYMQTVYVVSLSWSPVESDLIGQEHVPKKETETYLRTVFQQFPIIHIHVPKAHYAKSDGKPGGLGYAFVTFESAVDLQLVIASLPWKPLNNENVDAILNEANERSMRVLPM